MKCSKLSYVLAAGGFLLAGGLGAAQAALTIESAVWDGRRLTVEGTDGTGGTVAVYYGYDDPANSDLLGSASVKGNGDWKLQVKSSRNNPLDPVPCAVREPSRPAQTRLLPIRISSSLRR